MLEKRVLQFEKVVGNVLARHGKEVSDKQMELRRVADIAIDLFAMTAVLSRASRAYSIRLSDADHEVFHLMFLLKGKVYKIIKL